MAWRNELKQYLSAQRAWAEHWRAPEEIDRQRHELRRNLKYKFPQYPNAYIRHTAAQGLREIFIVAQCAKLIGVKEIKLQPANSFSDALIMRDAAEVNVEVTEVLDPERFRNDEYCTWNNSIEMVSDAEMAKENAKIIPALQSAVSKKKTKRYPSNTELYVYLNLGWRSDEEDGETENMREAIINEISRPHPFHKIFVFGLGSLCDGDGVVRKLAKPETDSVGYKRTPIDIILANHRKASVD